MTDTPRTDSTDEVGDVGLLHERFTRLSIRWECVSECNQCGRSDASALKTTGKPLKLWRDNESGESVCETCKRIRSDAGKE
jgi:hypothetical protein